MPNALQDIGRIIQERRNQLALNQQDLAEMAQVTIKTIYAIENNKGNPTIQVLDKILEVLGLEIKIQIKTIVS
jgi:y4mF family transcriptional regulator